MLSFIVKIATFVSFYYIFCFVKKKITVSRGHFLTDTEPWHCDRRLRTGDMIFDVVTRNNSLYSL